MEKKKSRGLLIISLLFTIFIIILVVKCTWCLGEFMSLKEAKYILHSEEKEDQLNKLSYYKKSKFEDKWKIVDNSIKIRAIGGDGISINGYEMSTEKYILYGSLKVQINENIRTEGSFTFEDFEFKVVAESGETYLIKYDDNYVRNEEMEQAVGLSTKEVVEEVRQAKKSIFDTLNEVSRNEWKRIFNKAIRNIIICAVLWILTILQCVYRYKKYRSVE